MNKEINKEISVIVKKVLLDTALQTRDPAASRPLPAVPEAVRLPGEPILVEMDGWGLYTPDPSPDLEGSSLTHIGCDCVYPYWALAHNVLNLYKNQSVFKCQECEAPLVADVYHKLVNWYRFVNNISTKNDEWDI